MTCREALNFTSVLYLGLRHPSASLRHWSQFTMGVPAALDEYQGGRRVAGMLAALQGCEDAALAPSTLHVSWDLFGAFADSAVTIYQDEGVYPIIRWGVERAAGLGTPVRTFPHYDVDALNRMLEEDRYRRRLPVVVSDGICPGCGKPAPVVEYLKCIQRFGGRLILDDTQSLGILGRDHCACAPYGRDGGGVLPWSNIRGNPHVLVVTSLAKGFGVPVAALSGSRETVKSFEAKSKTRVHCSPPSIAVIRAAEHALEVNAERGDAIRLRLARLVRYFRNKLREIGLFSTGGLFPAQTLSSINGQAAAVLHERLRRQGVNAVLHQGKGRQRGVPRISFLINARHRIADVDRAVEAMGHILSMKARRGLNARVETERADSGFTDE